MREMMFGNYYVSITHKKMRRINSKNLNDDFSDLVKNFDGLLKIGVDPEADIIRLTTDPLYRVVFTKPPYTDMVSILEIMDIDGVENKIEAEQFRFVDEIRQKWAAITSPWVYNKLRNLK